MTLENFFNEYFENYTDDMDYQDFLSFLRNERILDARRNNNRVNNKYSLYFTEELDLNDGYKEDFSVIVEHKLENYYTKEQARDKTVLSENKFNDCLLELEIVDENDSYTEYALQENFVTNFGLITERGIEAISAYISSDVDNRRIEHSWIIQWVGPFSSKENCIYWVENNSISDKEFNFYYIKGKRYRQRNDSFYIGKCTQDRIYYRWRDQNHYINEFDERNGCEIWIGRFSDSETRKSNINERNNFINHVEHALISGFYYLNHNNLCLLNQREIVNWPYPICVVNQWYNTNYDLYDRNNGINQHLPDVIFYSSNDNFKFAKRLKLPRD